MSPPDPSADCFCHTRSNIHTRWGYPNEYTITVFMNNQWKKMPRGYVRLPTVRDVGCLSQQRWVEVHMNTPCVVATSSCRKPLMVTHISNNGPSTKSSDTRLSAGTINKPHLPYKTGIDVMQSHPLHRTHFGQYQASSAALGWPHISSIVTCMDH